MLLFRFNVLMQFSNYALFATQIVIDTSGYGLIIGKLFKAILGALKSLGWMWSLAYGDNMALPV